MVKVNTYIYGDFISLSLNSSIKASKFPENLKLADITPLYKKGKKDIKKSYRPVSIISNLSKIFEKCIFKQIPHFSSVITKISMWLYEQFQYQKLSFSNAGQIEKVCR